MIHPLADCQATVPESTRIWQFCVVLPEAEIGDNCNVCSHCFIENDVKIGNNVTIKCGVQLWDGLRVEDDVFIGANVSFTNDRYPRSKQYPARFEKTVVRQGASIGAGSVVVHDIPAGVLAAGNPCRVIRQLDEK